MGETIHHFKTIEDYKEYMENSYQEPFVSCINYDKTTIRYNKTEEEKERERLLRTPLTFEIQSDGDIIWKTNSTGSSRRTIEYSKDNGQTWTEITSATGDTAPSISVVSGDTVQFRGNNATYFNNMYYNWFSESTCSFSLKGNIMSLINSTDFSDLTTLESAYTFYSMFRNCTGLTDASNLVLPATTLRGECYQFMFEGCTNLTTAPALPATTLVSSCYHGMFCSCTSLTQAPELPATTLANHCYSHMFSGCTSLTQGPSSIGTPATTMVASACTYMFANCKSLTTAPELPATTLANYCYNGMFSNCNSLTTAPELPATTLAKGCYDAMFHYCSNLNYIKCLATDISASNCTYGWVNGVASTGTFVKNSAMTGWTTGIGGIPSGWTVQDAS